MAHNLRRVGLAFENTEKYQSDDPSARRCMYELCATTGYGEPNSTKVVLNKAVTAKGARCLDGSPAVYNILTGWGDGKTKWIIHFQGRFYCVGLC